MKLQITRLNGIVTPGYQVASGQAENSPFPAGSIDMQLPYFKQAGWDLHQLIPNLYLGTININIAPLEAHVIRPDFVCCHVKWTDHIAPEDFLFVTCQVIHHNKTYDALVYYPSPHTKPAMHKHNFQCLEILSSKIPNLCYNDPIQLDIKTSSVDIMQPLKKVV